MIIKSMFSAAAVTVMLFSTLSVQMAEAKTNVDVNIGIGVGGGYYDPGYYDPAFIGSVEDYDHFEPDEAVTCWQARKIVRLNGFRNISLLDCEGPNYKFAAWRNGVRYKIRVNGWGDITRVRRW